MSKKLEYESEQHLLRQQQDRLREPQETDVPHQPVSISLFYTDLSNIDESHKRAVEYRLNFVIQSDKLFTTCKTIEFEKTSFESISVLLVKDEILISFSKTDASYTIHYFDWLSFLEIIEKYYNKDGHIQINWPTNKFVNCFRHINKPINFSLKCQKSISITFSDSFDLNLNMWSNKRTRVLYLTKTDINAIFNYLAEINDFITGLRRLRPIFALVSLSIAKYLKLNFVCEPIRNQNDIEAILEIHQTTKLKSFAETIVKFCNEIIATKSTKYRSLYNKIINLGMYEIDITNTLQYTLQMYKNQIFLYYIRESITGNKTSCITGKVVEPSFKNCERCLNPLCCFGGTCIPNY